MNAPTLDYTLSDTTHLYAQWTTLSGANKGGSLLTISTYDLFWYDSSLSVWTIITTTSNTYYLHGGLTGG